MNTISWASPTTPLPDGDQPARAFERLFGDGGSDPQRRQNCARGPQHPGRDHGEARALQSRLGARDRARMSDYLDDVREIERRIQQAEASSAPTSS